MQLTWARMNIDSLRITSMHEFVMRGCVLRAVRIGCESWKGALLKAARMRVGNRQKTLV